MTRQKSAKITLFQLFFLSFSYVFSGLFLSGARSLLSFLIPLGAMVLCSSVGFFLLGYAPRTFAEKGRFLSFLSMGRVSPFAKLLGVLFSFSAVAEALVSVIALTFSAHAFSRFIPFWLVFALTLALSLFAAWHGLTAVGRFSELMLLPIVPFFLYLLLWNVEPMAIGRLFEHVYVFFLVMPAPVFYLLSMTVSESTAMPKAVKDLRLFPLTMCAGALLAVLCMSLFMLYGADDGNVIFLFFGWVTGMIRAGMLFCVTI